ncbi:hypothetical protein BaRGS_00026722 [Batillaria attramentaria]|uniref:GH18 domain-containing protein n=1 Tax=Batillaria attramentaria TaxID=370345 RepID=A0ABD0K3P3_9CAEN
MVKWSYVSTAACCQLPASDSMKADQPSLKVLLDIGGWPMGSEEFTKLVSSQSNMQTFAANAIKYLRQFNFDGLVIDWEYPVTRPPSTLMEAFENEVQGNSRPRLLLAAGISTSPWQISQSFELPDISEYVDWLDLRAMGLHGTWEGGLDHHAALYSPTWDEKDSILIVNASVPSEKLDLGIPFYGQYFNLTDPTNYDVGAPINGGGTMAYYEICKLLTENSDSVTTGRLSNTKAPYVVDGSRWTGYDDAMSIQEKVDYVMEHGLGGVAVFSIDMDDFNGLCGGESNPLLHTIQRQFSGLVG